MVGIGNKLRKLREDHNYKQDFVGKYIGLSQAGYSKLEADDVENFNFKHLQKLAELYKVNLSQILDWDGKVNISFVNNQDHGVVYNHGTINNNIIEDKMLVIEEKLDLLLKKIG